MQKHNLPSLSIIALSSIVVLSSLTSIDASAQQIYQWKDEKGRVHFGERPPRDQNSEKVSIKAPKYLDGHSRRKTSNASQEKSEATKNKEVANNEKENKEKQKKKEAEYKKNCDNARQLMAQMNSPENTKFTMPDGSVKTMPAAERAKKKAQAQASIDFYCR